MNDPTAILNEDNYFVWEFNTRLKLIKKGLLDHIDATKVPIAENQVHESWRVNDLKAFAIISMSIGISFQSFIDQKCSYSLQSVGNTAKLSSEKEYP